MTTLQSLLDENRATTGIGRLIVMQRIRQYVQSSSRNTLLDEISRIWESEDLNVLIGAGMRHDFYYAVLAQKAKIAGIT